MYPLVSKTSVSKTTEPSYDMYHKPIGTGTTSTFTGNFEPLEKYIEQGNSFIHVKGKITTRDIGTVEVGDTLTINSVAYTVISVSHIFNKLTGVVEQYTMLVG